MSWFMLLMFFFYSAVSFGVLRSVYKGCRHFATISSPTRDLLREPKLALAL